MQWCKDFQQLQKDNKDFKKDRDIAMRQLSAYSKDVFDKNQEKVNEVLRLIDADFRVKNFNERADFRRLKPVSCSFELEFFNQHCIQLEGTDEEQTFKNTLSQADKNSLAFAFFISSLSNDEELKNKIVVVDDPVSSYDEERQLVTARLLAEIKNQNNEAPAQKIILTHNKNFLIKLYRQANFSNAKFIKIVKDGIDNGVKKSAFAECDVFAEFIKPEEMSYLDEVQDLIDNDRTIPADAHDKFRKVFEAAFKSKYYLFLRDDIYSRKGVRGFTEKLVSLTIYTDEKAQKLNSLFDKLQIPHHDNEEIKVSENSQGDLKTILQESIELLKEI